MKKICPQLELSTGHDENLPFFQLFRDLPAESVTVDSREEMTTMISYLLRSLEAFQNYKTIYRLAVLLVSSKLIVSFSSSNSLFLCRKQEKTQDSPRGACYY